MSAESRKEERLALLRKMNARRDKLDPNQRAIIRDVLGSRVYDYLLGVEDPQNLEYLQLYADLLDLKLVLRIQSPEDSEPPQEDSPQTFSIEYRILEGPVSISRGNVWEEVVTIREAVVSGEGAFEDDGYLIPTRHITWFTWGEE